MTDDTKTPTKRKVYPKMTISASASAHKALTDYAKKHGMPLSNLMIEAGLTYLEQAAMRDIPLDNERTLHIPRWVTAADLRTAADVLDVVSRKG
jgi:hypothetical protein